MKKLKGVVVAVILLGFFLSSNSFAKNHTIGLGEKKAIGMGSAFASIMFYGQDAGSCFVKIDDYGGERLSIEAKIKKTKIFSQDTALGKVTISCKEGKILANIQPLASIKIEVAKEKEKAAGPPIMVDNYPEDMTNVPIPPEMHFEEAPRDPALIIPPTGEMMTGMP